MTVQTFTTPEQRTALEAIGWRLAETSELFEMWACSDGCAYVFPGAQPGPTMRKGLEFAAVLGFAPPGYRMVPAEVATEAAIGLSDYADELQTQGNVAMARRWKRYADALKETGAIT